MAVPTLAYSRPDFAAGAHHRVANSLALLASIVRMQASAFGKRPDMVSCDEVRTVLEELGNRVHTIARLHGRLAAGPPDGAVALGDYLRDVAAAVVSALSAAGQVRLRFACEKDCLVAPERALPLGLIVAELVTNAVKYAHPAGVAGEISVACGVADDQTVTIEVSDDGIGLPEGFDPMKNGNLGLQLVRCLASELAARISFAHDPLGTSFELKMPTETVV
ncbi:sensor histidine kinase [Dongia deserti]|uniref:sensor histidine kinase n=1 Tax=Dongia deserti TaxID=2268030 RepID=UPI0013C47A3B|nr:sensor histidine kinase [Dongia deserti]